MHIWFLPNDPAIEALEDEGLKYPPKFSPSRLSLSTDTLGYNIAVPPAGSRVFKDAESGPYPIMWTRGLDRGDTEWSEDSPWEGEGGHVLFSNGKVEWYDSTQSDEQPEGVFKNNTTTDRGKRLHLRYRRGYSRRLGSSKTRRMTGLRYLFSISIARFIRG